MMIDEQLSPQTKKMMLVQYEKLMATKQGNIYEHLDIPFNMLELTFFYQLADWYCTEEPSADQKKIHEIALLSTLIFLSSKIHFAITENLSEETALRQKMQFPILIGDLLYSLFLAEIVEQDNLAYLNDYMAYLIIFNSSILDYIDGQYTLQDFLSQTYQELISLTLAIYLKHSTTVLKKAFWQDCAQKIGVFLAQLSSNEPISAVEDNLNDFYRQLERYKNLKVKSFTDIVRYLSGSEII